MWKLKKDLSKITAGKWKSYCLATPQGISFIFKIILIIQLYINICLSKHLNIIGFMN